jgi:ABC-type transport system involved in multi-copper enzyme maturation permease subunit
MISSLRPALVITRREIRDQLRDWRIIIPTVVLTLFFPALMNLVAEQIIDFMQRYGTPILGDRLVPFLLMVVGFFPISFTLVIALESFVGEKERRSLEPLLSSPLTDVQLYVGKLLAVTVPPLLASFMAIIVYLIGVYRQLAWQPEPVLLIQVISLTVVQALLMVSGAVIISSQTTSTRAANLLASFIIIPVAILLIIESFLMFWADYSVLWWLIFGQVIVASLFIRTGIAHFNREELLGRELDVIDLRWGWRVFANAFKGGARSPKDWYIGVIQKTLKGFHLPLGLNAVMLVLAFSLGMALANEYYFPVEALELDNLKEGISADIEGLGVVQFFTVGGVATIWIHNLRTILIATLFGLFSFGVLGVLMMMLPFILIGYFTATIAQLGVSPWLFLTAAVLPHGVLEIPAILLAGSIILKLGVNLSTPTPGYSISEAMLRSLGNWARIMIALVLPLLLGAAILEIFITPRIVILLFGT